MFTHLFETCRKTSEFWLQTQQDLAKTAVQQLTALTPDMTGAATEWKKVYGERFVDVELDVLNRHRQSLFASHDVVIALIRQTLLLREAKTAEDSRALLERLWREWFSKITAQSESRLKDAQHWALKSIELVQKAQA